LCTTSADARDSQNGTTMTSLPRPTLREFIRAVAAGIVVVFVISAVSIAYAAGRHSSRDESSQQGRFPVSAAHRAR
jgi:hypothetical protein